MSELWNTNAEEYVIVGALADPNEMDDMLAALRPEHFYRASHQDLWRTYAAMRGSGVAADEFTPTLVAAQWQGQSPVAGVEPMLEEMIRAIPSAFGWKRHAELIRDLWRRRAAIRAAQLLVERMQGPAPDTMATLSRAAAHLADLTTDIDSADPRNISEFVREAQEVSKVDGGIPGLLSPWGSVNSITTGWKPGQLIVVAAGTGVGKSAFAAAIANHNLEAGVLLFSLEMLGREVASRMVCMRAGVDSRRYDLGWLTPMEREQCDTEAARLTGNLWLDDTAGTNIAALRAKALRWIAKHHVAMVIVDYLGLVDEKIEGGNRVQVVGAISRGLKMLAMEAKVPVVALHQLNRDSAKEKREPQLHDLRDSGNVEQDANQVILLHRQEQCEGVDKIKVRVAKNRGGPISSTVLNFRRQCTRFEEIVNEQYQGD